MSFGLAARIARMFGGTVDAIHFSETHQGDLDIASQAMPFLKRLSDDRLKSRAAESERAFRELIEPLADSTFAGGDDMTRDRLIMLGRFASLVLLGRPGGDAENIAPSTVKHVLYDCARPVVIAPPNLPSHPPSSVVVAWNGSVQAARAVGAALPFLEKARKVVIMAGAEPNAVGAPRLVRYLARRGIAAAAEAMDSGALSGRARGRALLGYARDKEADLLVMGAYGHGQLSNFLGLGGATAKVISSCPIPLLLAH
ncbi:MAG: universal stress protein [Reyranellaceae bacterium]